MRPDCTWNLFFGLGLTLLLMAFPVPVRGFAVVAREYIAFNGSNILIDSFDSSDPMFSTNGVYTSERRKDGGDVVSFGVGKLSWIWHNVASIESAKIAGHLRIGQGLSPAIGSGASVGSIAWHDGNNLGIESGWLTFDAVNYLPYFYFPYHSGATPGSGTVVSPQPAITATPIVSSNYPSPIPEGGVFTNENRWAQTTRPDPEPPGMVTNWHLTTTATLPVPLPDPPIDTNTLYYVTPSYPAPGTYLGNVVTNYQGTGTNIKNYAYNRIISYTYPFPVYEWITYTYWWNEYTTNTVYVTNFYDNVLYAGDYYVTNLTGQTIVLGDCRLVVTSAWLPSGSDAVTIKPGASLQVFVGGFGCNFDVDQVTNETAQAKNLAIFGCFDIGDFVLHGSGTFRGVIIAPEVRTIVSGSPSGLDFSGMVWGESVILSGTVSLHFDESLKQSRVFPPTIVRQPQPTNVLAGTDARFEVQAHGGDLRYLWFKAVTDTNNPNFGEWTATAETNQSMVVTNPGAVDGARYFVLIANEAGQTISASALLGIDYPPFISQQPFGLSVLAGSNVTFAVEAGGTYPGWGTASVRYQWRVGDLELPGATNFLLSLPDAQTNDAGLYSVVVTNQAGSITSSPAALLVYESAVSTLSFQPEVESGQFQLSVTGVPTFRYVIEGSTNLLDWIRVATNQSPFNFIDADVDAHPQRFYRAVYLP